MTSTATRPPRAPTSPHPMPRDRTVLVLAVRASLEWLRTCNTGTGVRLSGLVSAPRPAVEALP